MDTQAKRKAAVAKVADLVGEQLHLDPDPSLCEGFVITCGHGAGELSDAFEIMQVEDDGDEGGNVAVHISFY